MNARAAAVDALKARLGHAFANESLLERALTHASVAGAHAKVRTNEVLEFVGDRVLGLLVAERLAAADPMADEGLLAVRLNALVNREACARAAGAALVGHRSRRGTSGRRQHLQALDLVHRRPSQPLLQGAELIFSPSPWARHG